VKALLRRTGRTPQPPRLNEVRIGMAMLDLQRRLLVLADGAEAKLSASEFELLRLFVENPNRPLTRDWLLEPQLIVTPRCSTAPSTIALCVSGESSNAPESSRGHVATLHTYLRGVQMEYLE
jgi:hypothetical protein